MDSATEKLGESIRRSEAKKGKAGTKSATNGAAADGETKPPAIWIDEDAWDEAAIPPRPWIVPEFALRGSVTLLTGAPSALKSTFILGVAVSIALKCNYGPNFSPKSAGNVLVYNVEDDREEQRRRLSATLRYFGATPRDIMGKVVQIGPEHIGLLYVRDEFTGKISHTPAMSQFIDLIAERRPDVVVVDPLAELHNVQENDNNAIRLILAEFRSLAIRYNMAVIVLHHTKKGAGQAAGDPDASRGASSLVGVVRIAMTITTMSEEDAAGFGMPTSPEGRSYFARVDDAKQNYAMLRAARYWLEKVPHKLDNGEEVAAAVPWQPPGAKVASLNDLLALATAIERGAPDGQPWGHKLDNTERSVRTLLMEHGFVTKDAQQAALRRLETDHAVTVAEYKKPNRSYAQGLRNRR